MTNKEIKTKIERCAVNGVISRSTLNEVRNAASPMQAYRILQIMKDTSKQTFSLERDLTALFERPYTTLEAWAVIDKASELISHREGVGVTRANLLKILNDGRLPETLGIKLKSILNAPGANTNHYFLRTEFENAFK